MLLIACVLVHELVERAAMLPPVQLAAFVAYVSDLAGDTHACPLERLEISKHSTPIARISRER